MVRDSNGRDLCQLEEGSLRELNEILHIEKRERNEERFQDFEPQRNYQVKQAQKREIGFVIK